jgi:acyl transferase domain-containing protein
VIQQVKPNVGHSEGASGITSIIKAILSLEHKIIPPNIHFTTPNPKIPFAEANLHVPLEPTPWPDRRPQRISVNSFGIGGSNSHAILESASTIISKPIPVSIDRRNNPQLLVVSAHTADTLRKRIDQITKYNNNHPERIHDLSHTLGNRRDHLSHRGFAVLQPSSAGLENAAFTSSNATSPYVIFVFTGQGAQWPGMGKGLLSNFPKFKHDIKRMDEALQELPNGPSWLLYGQFGCY